MRFLKYIFCALLFVTAAVADTININWMDGNTTYAQTTCEIGGDIILPSPPTKRGYTFKGWVAGYTRLEYIDVPNDAYIDLGIYPSTHGRLRVKFAPITVGSNYLCGGRVNSSLYSGVMGASSSNSINSTMVRDDSVHSSAAGTITREANNIYDIEARAKYVEGSGYTTELKITNVTTGATETVTDERFIANPISVNQNMLLFAVNTTNKLPEAKGYLYMYWDDNDELVRNLIPAKRNSDNVVGMYDTVSKTFFTNRGTGEFIAGPVAENQSFYE